MKTIHGRGLGWHRDLPDMRDHTQSTSAVAKVLAKSSALKKAAKTLPVSVDLRKYCSPIEDQGQLGSCTAHAGVGMVEYFERRAFGKHVDASRLFLYKVTRQLLGFTGDDGAYLRDTMKALVLFGVPPEKYWPYDVAKFNDDPSNFCFSYAQNYQAINYYRLDPPNTLTATVLKNVKTSLAGQLPAMFGFSVYSSMPRSGDGKGEIPYPTGGDTLDGGHAVLAVGYDDQKKIGSTKGALLIRNSWGTDWGDGGYGWLPYAYIEDGLADDFWSLVKAEFVDSDLFK
ncbi:MAG: cysteine protease [Nitrosomonas sp.]|uniref:C1 family peptidase n=1 Tax=Nitrosomonas sp. TaxID=42353 RepID=UPI0032EE7B9E